MPTVLVRTCAFSWTKALYLGSSRQRLRKDQARENAKVERRTNTGWQSPFLSMLLENQNIFLLSYGSHNSTWHTEQAESQSPMIINAMMQWSATAWALPFLGASFMHVDNTNHVKLIQFIIWKECLWCFLRVRTQAKQLYLSLIWL